MNSVVDGILGNLSPSARVWTAMAPALVLAAYFLVGFLIYAVRYALRGAYRDPEMEARGSSVLATMWVRLYFAWLIQPLWKLILRSGIPPNAVTTLSALMALASGVALAAGRFSLGGWLYIFSGTLDVLDGRLARARKVSSPAGGALDSILDRYADSAVLCGLVWYYRDSWVLVPVLLALVGSSLVPYIRARGEAYGVTVKVGVMQRAERIMYLGVACAVSPVLEVVLAPGQPHPPHRIAIAGVVLLAVATQLTALRRLTYLLSALRGRTPSRLASDGSDATRFIVTAAAATLADFAVVSSLVERASVPPPLATGIGCVVGGLAIFASARVWTSRRIGAQAPRLAHHAFVTATSAVLNVGGVALLLALPVADYWVAWLLARGAVGLAWNFPLRREHELSPRDETTPGPQTAA